MRTLLLLLLPAVALAKVPAWKERPEIVPLANVRLPIPSVATPSAVRTVLLERHEIPLVHVVVTVQAGSELDPAEKSGLAALTARYLDEGGAGSRSATEVAEAFEALGAELKTDIDPSGVRLSLAVASPQLDAALAVLAEVVAHPRFSPADLAGVKARLQAEIQRLNDEPRELADLLFARAVFGAGAYGQPPYGVSATVDKLTVDDVRAFYAAHYGPATTSVIVVGDARMPALQKTVAGLFGAWHSTASVMRPPAAPSPLPSRIVLIDRPGAPQSELRIGHLGVTYASPDLPSVEILEMALGGSFTSRLVQNLRERNGYTYGARAAWDLYRGAGSFAVQLAVRTDVTAASIKEVIAELDGARGGMPEAELRKSRALVVHGYLERAGHGAMEAETLAQLVLTDQPPDLLNQLAAKVLAVDGKTLAAAAPKLVRTSELVVVVVGDRKKIEPSLRALKLPLEIQ
jgi:zinc protease